MGVSKIYKIMITPEFLLLNYGRNLTMLDTHAGHLDHAGALLQPHPRANCAYWIVGHLNVYRARLLVMLGGHPHMSESSLARFVPGTPPVKGEEPGMLRFEALRRAMQTTQAPIESLLLAAAPEMLAAKHSFGPMSFSATEWLVFYMRHEAFHVGQLELCGELAK